MVTADHPTTADSAQKPDQHDPVCDDAEIAKLAYSFYEQRGSVDGHHEEDWHRAEQYFRNLRLGDSSITRRPA